MSRGDCIVWMAMKEVKMGTFSLLARGFYGCFRCLADEGEWGKGERFALSCKRVGSMSLAFSLSCYEKEELFN